MDSRFRGFKRRAFDIHPGGDTIIHLLMDEMDEIRLRMRVSRLEARLALLEIEAAALSREIASPLTSEGEERKRQNVAIPLWLKDAPS